VLNHVLLHQTVIGQAALKQMDAAGEYPNVVIGCVGGGSNFAGLAFPFVGEKLRDGKRTRILAVEPEACPTLTRGTYAYDFGDTVGLTPLVKMHTLGHSVVPPAIHAGGLRYHGGERRVILFNLTGHGHFDMGAYDAYLAGGLQDYAYPAEAIQHALTELPSVAVLA